MSTEIDKRVVEMQFNNKDFEKNAQASLTTIEKLKMALNFDGAKGLESLTKAANKVDLSNISKSADAVAVKFSAMQIAGVTAIQQLTLSFMNFGKTLWNSSFGQIKSGGMARALKIEQANFQMKALAENIDAVKKGLIDADQLVTNMGDSIDRAVSGTAYGYDAAASVAAQLMASGLTDSKKMYNHLRAIAGAASMTGRDFENIGNIFTTVASNGKLMTMQLRQFSAAGLNMSATLAKYFNTTEDAINEMVRDGKVSFEDFSAAIYDAFGKAAGEADKMFSGVTKNVKAQLSRIGQLFAQPYIENMIPFLQKLKDTLKEVNAALRPIANAFDYMFGKMMTSAAESLDKFDATRLNSIFSGVLNILTSIYHIVGAIKDAFVEVFPRKTIDELHEIAIEFEGITLQLLPSKETLDGLKQFIKVPLIIVKIILKAFKSILKGLSPIINSFKNLFGAIARFGEVFTSLNEVILDGVNKSNALEMIFLIIGTAISHVIDLITILVNVLRVVFTSILNSTTFRLVLGFLNSLINMISTGVIIALYLISSIISYIFSKIDLDTILSALKTAKDYLTKIFGYLTEFLKFMLNFVLSAVTGIASIGQGVKVIAEWFKKGWTNIKNFFSEIDDGEKTTETALERLMSAFERIKERFDNLFKGLTAGKVLLIAFSVGAVLLVFALEKLIKNLADLAKHANVAFSVFDILKNGISKAIQFSPMLQVLIGIAVTIGAVTASIVTLGRDLSDAELKRAAIALGSFLLILLTVSAILVEMGKTLPNNLSAIRNVMTSLGTFSVGILALSVSLKLLSGLDLDLKHMITSFTAITILIGELAVVAFILGQNVNRFDKEKEGIHEVSVNFIGLSIAILALSNAFKIMSKIDSDKVLQSIMSFTTVMYTFALVITAAGFAAKQGFGIKTGLGISLIISSLTTLFILFLVLSLIPFDTIGKSLLKMLMIMTPLIAFMAVIGEVILRGNKLDKKRNIEVLQAMTKMIGLFSLTLIAMTILVAALGKMELSKLVQGTVAISVMSILIEMVVSKFISVADKLFKEFGKTKDGYKNFNNSLQSLAKMITAFSLIILSMSASAMMLQNVSLWGMLAATGAFLLVVNNMNKVIEASEKTKDAKMGPLLALSVVMMALFASIATIAFFYGGSWEMIAQFAVIAGIFVAVMAVLAVVIKAINAKEFKRPEATKTVYKAGKSMDLLVISITTIILAIAALAYVVTKYQSTFQGNLLIGTLIGVMLTIALIFESVKELSTFKNNGIKEANDLDRSGILKGVASIIGSVTALIIGIGAVIGGLAYLTKDKPETVIGPAIATITAVIGLILVIALGLIPKLNEAANNSTSKEDFTAKFESIKSAIDSIIYGVLAILISVSAAGILIHMTGSLGEFAVALGVLAVALGGIIGALALIFTKMKKIHQDKQETMNNTFEILGKLILHMGIAVTMMVSATALLATAFKGSNWWTILLTIGTFVTAIVGLYFVIKKLGNNLDENKVEILSKLKWFILSLSGSVTLMMAGIAGMAYVFNSVAWYEVLQACIAFIVVVGSLVASVWFLSKYVKQNDVSTLLAASGSIVIITSSLMLIALAIKMLYDTMSKDASVLTHDQKMDKLSSCFAKIFATLVTMILSVVLMAKNIPKGKNVEMAMLSAMILSISILVLTIASAVSELNNVKISDEVVGLLNSLMLIIAAFVSILTLLSGKSSWTTMLASSAVILTFGITAKNLADGIKVMAESFKTITPEQMEHIKSVIIWFYGIMAVLTGVFGIIGAALQGNAIYAALLMATFAADVLSFGVSAVMFGLGVKLLAEGVDQLIGLVQKVNDLNIDGQRIRENIKQGIMGFAQGIWDSLGYVAQALVGVITIILETLIASIGLLISVISVIMAAVGIGILAAAPILLAVITELCKLIAEWAKDDTNINIIQDAGEAIGKALAAGILGIVSGIGDVVWNELKAVLKKLKNELDAAFNNFVTKTASWVVGYDVTNPPIPKESPRERANREQQEKEAKTGANTVGGNGASTRKSKTDTHSTKNAIKTDKEATKAKQDLEKATDKAAIAMKRQEEVMNGGSGGGDGKLYAPALKGTSALSAHMSDLAMKSDLCTKKLKDNDDALVKLAEDASDTSNSGKNGSILDFLLNSGKEHVKEEGTEAVKDTFAGMAGDAVDAVLPEGIKTIKEKLSPFVSSETLDLLESFALGKSSLEDIYNNYAQGGIMAALGFSNGFESKNPKSWIGELLGVDMTNAKSYGEWVEYGEEKAYFEGNVARYQYLGYASASKYADAMQEKYGTMSEIYSKALLGDDWDPLGETGKKATEELEKMTKSLNGLGEEEDEVAKKTDALADSISNALDIFSEFNDTAEMTGHDVLKSFMSQITGVSKWSTELKALAGKGFSQALLEDLASLGPQGYEKVHALYTMSAKEMSLFNKMYVKKLSLESSTATDILASFQGNADDIAEVYSEELTEQMQNATSEGVQKVGEGIVSEMAAIPERAGTAIGEAAFPLTNAFAELGMSSMEAFKKQMDFEEALEAVKVFQAGIINSTTLGSKLFDELGESEEISSKKMLDNMKRQVMNVGEWVSEINTLVARGASEGLVNQLMEMGPEGKAKVDAFVKMTDSELKEANRLYEASAKLPQVSADRITKSYAMAGYNASLGFTEGIDPEAAQNAMYMLAEHSLEYLEAALDINSPSKKTMEIGIYTVEGFISGIINETSKYKLRNACASITTIIKDSFKNNLSATTFRSIADDCMAGLANGIMASATDAAIKAAEAAKKVTEAVKNAFDTHSPSLIFKWIGQMLMLGLGDGIIEQGDTTAETAALTAKNVIDNVMVKLASMSEYDEQAYTPVIRPVVDMSNVDQGYNDIRSWFDQQGSISMMGNIRLNTNNENGSSDVNRIVDAINNINNQDVVDEIASLRNDISTLQDSMSRLQVVMDTGSLVGQLVQPMDQALGTRAVTNSRGRYS